MASVRHVSARLIDARGSEPAEGNATAYARFAKICADLVYTDGWVGCRGGRGAGQLSRPSGVSELVEQSEADADSEVCEYHEYVYLPMIILI